MLTTMLYVVLGAVALFVLSCAYMAYRLLLRDMGRVKFRFAFVVPSVDPKTVWTTYFDGKNLWNSSTERLSFDVISQSPLVVRSRARARDVGGEPSTFEWQFDEFLPGQRAHSRLIKLDGVEVPAEKQSRETFVLTRGVEGTKVDVEVEMPVRGSLSARLQWRDMKQVFADLQSACLEKAGVPYEKFTRCGADAHMIEA